MVWQAAALPFGRTQVQLGTVQNNLHFPGQYYDAETGLHCNWNRYYDSDTGRYISPRPHRPRWGTMVPDCGCRPAMLTSLGRRGRLKQTNFSLT